MLEKLGCQVEIAETGNEAVEKTARQTYALVLMDVNLPELDGIEAARRIRMREGGKEHIPIVALTAHAMPYDRERCLSAGMDEYMSKPIELAKLAKTLNDWASISVQTRVASRRVSCGSAVERLAG